MNDVERATAKARCLEDADFTNVFQAKTAWERGFDACWDIVHHKHVFWAAGETDCPRDIKAANGELYTLRCKVCGSDNFA